MRTGWSKGELARQVNRRARRMGALHVSTDTSRVRRWLDGEQPREPIPKLMSELFSEHFGCVVTEEDLGLRAAPAAPALSGVDLPWSGERTVRMLGEFSRSDLMVGRGGWLGSSLSVTAGPDLVESMQRWLGPAPGAARFPDGAAQGDDCGLPLPRRRPGASFAGTPEHLVPGPAGSRVSRLSAPEVELLEETTRRFREWDAQCGGGLRRKAVVGQLHEVTDLLQEPNPPELRARLFRTAGELAHLAGWMSYDVGMQPSAQKYFVLALHAAKEAGDRTLGAFVLSAMARQMLHLNRAEEALELVHLAQYGSRGSGTPRTTAMLLALEARAHANLGEPNRCHRAACQAETVFQETAVGGEEPEPDWMAFFTEAELHAENGHSYRDLAYRGDRSPVWVSRAVPELERAVALFAADGRHQRSHALNLVGLASVHLLQGAPAAAVPLAHRAVDIAVRIRSERVNTRLRRTTHAAVRSYTGVAEVVDLSDRLLMDLPELAAAG
ncbi:hypothetical protein [Mangrovactinospora gilvigrisea]|uniref:hypothetical protein n=1 Tax=Mangrovactinospora gilvigrisea TaxID=1428644 RepID=UPI000A996A0A|nr:hypothetical protein [Mangrovactinospora gilvigrisea]